LARLDKQPGENWKGRKIRKGTGLNISDFKGQAYIRSNARFNRGLQSDVQKSWVADFSFLACLSKYPDPYAFQRASELAKGTGWFWRDVITSGLNGKLNVWRGEVRVLTPTVYLTRSVAENMPNGSFLTLTPDTKLWDNNVFWGITVNPTRITVRSPGLYMIGAKVEFRPETDASRLALIRYDGAVDGITQSLKTGTDFPGWANLVDFHYFHANEYFEVRALVIGTSQTAKLTGVFACAITPEALIA